MKKVFLAIMTLCFAVVLKTQGQSQLIHTDEINGRVGINNSQPATTLDVNGTGTFRGDLIVTDENKVTQAKIYGNGHIRAREITVDNEKIPDYVFEPDYKLMSLQALEAYVKQHKHLPEIPSELEYADRNGVAVGELQLLLLKKVEELTLYILEQEKRIAELEKQLTESRP